jgi:hypothetical protein
MFAGQAMPFQVSRTDTGQFVLTDPVTDTVVIDDDVAAGFDKLAQAVADKPAAPSGPASTPEAAAGAADAATQGSSAFAFRGGPRYTPILLAVVLPFAWLAVLYLALSNLLSKHAIERGAMEEARDQIEALEGEVQALRTQMAGAPRTAKKAPTRKKQPKKNSVTKPKPAPKPAPTPGGSGAEKPAEGTSAKGPK